MKIIPTNANIQFLYYEAKMYYKLSFSRVVRKQSSDQTMVATTEDRGKLVRQKFFGFLIIAVINFIVIILVIIPGEKVRRRTWTKEEAEAAAKARLEVRRQEDNMKVVRWGWWCWWWWWKHLQKIFERGGHMIIKGRGFSKDKQTTTINKGPIKTE